MNAPVLIIDENGITDNMNFPTLGFVEWENVLEAKNGNIAGIDHILVFLKDAEAHIAQQNFLKRPFRRSNLESAGTCILFRSKVFPEKSDKIIELMNKLAKR